MTFKVGVALGLILVGVPDFREIEPWPEPMAHRCLRHDGDPVADRHPTEMHPKDSCRYALACGHSPFQASLTSIRAPGSDVIGRAETGSGKTAAFALPMLEILSRDPFGIFGIVLTPARELALQIAEQFRAIGTPAARPRRASVVPLPNDNLA